MTDQQILDNFDSLVANQPECKLIQLRMEKDFNFFEKIFDYMVPDFANYCIDGVTSILCLKIIEVAASQPQKAKKVVESFEDQVIKLCMDTSATRIVQKLIEKIHNKPELLQPILKEITGKVCMLVMCNNGNHVIQKLIQQTASEQIDFVYLEIIDRFKQIGVHKHGCCVVQRCIDQASPALKVEIADSRTASSSRWSTSRRPSLETCTAITWCSTSST